MIANLGRRVLPAVFLGVLLVGACSSSKDDEPYVERPVEELYGQATAAMSDGDYKKAAKLYDEVERQHPYSPWATHAQIQAAYAYYEANEYDDAIAALDRFIDLHPADKDVAYAYYLKGLSYYERISDAARDQKMTEDAKRVFQELINRYPESAYARDAKVKIDLANDHLSGREMVVGRYYLRRGYYVAAINRFRTVLQKYQTTTHVPEALLRLTEAYTALGLTDEARKAAAILGYNYPGSDWYADAYALVESKGG
ncbi:MAG: outer membrane protein assembly factor BamD [Rhodospirillales bacterium]|nr:outer membrane protein assembly factor BamD [Rhodospirillales bacterium]